MYRRPRSRWRQYLYRFRPWIPAALPTGAPQAVTTAHVASTFTPRVPSITSGQLVTSSHVASTFTAHAPRATYTQAITTATLASTFAPHAPTASFLETFAYELRSNPYFVYEVELDGFLNGWTRLYDVIIGTTSFSRGLPGAAPKDCVAKTGILSFVLNNSENNSAETLGYYTPGFEDALPNFAKNIGVRLIVVINGTGYVQFTGRILNLKTTTGLHGDRRVHVTCVDYMDQLARKRLSDLPLQVNAPDHEVFALIVNEMAVQPRATHIDFGYDTLSYVFDTMKAERAVPTSEIQRLCQSTLTKCLVWKDGTLVYESRAVRANSILENVIDLGPDDFMLNAGPDISDDRDSIVNLVQVTPHPRTPGTATDVILFSLDSVTPIAPNYPLAIRGLYTEPGLESRRAGGLDMLPADPYTDYELNTAADGSGTDVTLQSTVDTIYAASNVLFSITAPVSCYLLRLQSRGTVLVDQKNVIAEAKDEASIDAVGENAITLDQPYNGNVALSDEIARYILFLEQQTAKRVKSVPLLLNSKSIERQMLIVQREISDRVGVIEPMNALPDRINAGFFINSISAKDDSEGFIIFTWTLAIADATQYWYLEVPGFSELGSTTRLGFGLVIGHTDMAHDDFHNDTIHSDVAHDDQHGDTAHSDAAHIDQAHSDIAHSDAAHVDVAHDDSHYDSGHNDSSHSDAHSDAAYRDTHTDTPHNDTPHSDIAFQGYTDTHDDTHADGHGDHDDVPFVHDDSAHNDSHTDSHIDDGGHPHTDSPHYDGAHFDGHTDDAHGDTHTDVPHGDAGHADGHGDVGHSDISHSDTHTDTGHGDTGHGDTAHSDNHVDVAHSDIAHADAHGDFAHGDAN